MNLLVKSHGNAGSLKGSLPAFKPQTGLNR